MKKMGKIRRIVVKASACFGILGAALIITSPYSSHNSAGAIFLEETTNYSTEEESLLKIEAESLPVREAEIKPQIGEEASEPEELLHYDYTESEIDMLAKLVYAEAGACSENEQRLIVWTVFQRVDSADWDFRDMNDITTAVTAPNQFAYYESSTIKEEIRAICAEEIEKWANFGEPPIVPPYAPSLPYYFYEGDGYHNWFRAEW